MANPTALGVTAREDHDNMAIACDQVIVNSKVVVASQQALVSDAPVNAPTNASTSHDLNATFSDTEAEAALNALGTKLNSTATNVNTIGGKVNSILDILEAHGLMADA